jgi:hypothetical protein
MPLTDFAIKNARAGARAGDFRWWRAARRDQSQGRQDLEDGLSLRRQAEDRYGRQYPEMRLSVARECRENVKGTLREGRDPAREAKVHKQEAKRNQRDTFEAVGREWYEKNKSRWEPRYAALILRRLDLDPFRLFGSTPVAEVSQRDILDLIERYEKRDALEVACKVLNHVSAIMRYAISSGRRTAANPVPDTRDSLAPKPPVQHMSCRPNA